MGKHSNKEAYFKRLQELASVEKRASINENNGRALGTLIDFKKGADGYTYGIVKENHHYYIKKSNNSKNPNVTDFAYIGGLGNVTEYQYTKLSEADKNRNMILNTINEAYSQKMSKTSSKPISKKKMLSEGIDEDAEEEIAQAEDKFNDLEAATAAKTEPMPDMGGEEMPDMGGEEPEGEEMPDMGGEEPEGEPMPDMGGEEPEGEEGAEEVPDLDGLGLDNEEGGEEPEGEEPEGEEGGEEPDSQDEKSIISKEIEKTIGKLGNRIRKTELTDSQTISYLKQLISPFKNHVKDVEIEDRKEIADLILKTVPDEDIEDLDVTGEEDMEGLPSMEEEKCSECGSFVQYAESRGYTNESILNATNEEVANLAAGYINAHKDGMNEGDFDSVKTHLTNEACDMLKEEYGFDDEDLTNFQPEMNEMDGDQRVEKINELWGGLKNLGKAAGQGIAKGAQAVGQSVAKGAQAVGQAGEKAWDATKGAAQEISKTYHQGEVSGEIKKAEQHANEMMQVLNNLNNRLEKAGQQKVDINRLLQGAINQMIRSGNVDFSRIGAMNNVQREGLDDAAKVEVQPEFAQEQSLGVAVNEAEQKVRKYVRARLEEKMGLRKAKINESAKSESLKKLDSLIDKQFKLYETVIKRKRKLNENWSEYDLYRKMKDAIKFGEKVISVGVLSDDDNMEWRDVDISHGDASAAAQELLNIQAAEGNIYL